MMHGKFQLKVPNEAEATLTITATIGQWRELLNALEGISRYPMMNFRTIIREAVGAAEKAYLGKGESA